MIDQAIVAAGCFWGVEHLFKRCTGVMSTEVGYIGGELENPSYEDICHGDTGHAEALRIEFDSTELSYHDLLLYFFRLHDPTTLNRQGADSGTQYRSAIFYFNDEQRLTAKELINKLDQKKVFNGQIVTTLEMASKFYPAEHYHQHYLDKNPGGYCCHILRPEFPHSL